MTDILTEQTQQPTDETVSHFEIRIGCKEYTLPEKKPFKLRPNTYIIVTTNRGTECGRVVLYRSTGTQNHYLKQKVKIQEIVREATPEEKEYALRLNTFSLEIFEKARKIAQKIVTSICIKNCEVLFDRKKYLLHYVILEESNSKKFKAQLKNLHQTLVSEFDSKIELIEQNPRSLARTIDGEGICGRRVCCATFLEKFKTTTIKMAKIQNLPINATKLSGQCAKLKCCLRYELDLYKSKTKEDTIDPTLLSLFTEER